MASSSHLSDDHSVQPGGVSGSVVVYFYTLEETDLFDRVVFLPRMMVRFDPKHHDRGEYFYLTGWIPFVVLFEDPSMSLDDFKTGLDVGEIGSPVRKFLVRMGRMKSEKVQTLVRVQDTPKSSGIEKSGCTPSELPKETSKPVESYSVMGPLSIPREESGRKRSQKMVLCTADKLKLPSHSNVTGKSPDFVVALAPGFEETSTSYSEDESDDDTDPYGSKILDLRRKRLADDEESVATSTNTSEKDWDDKSYSVAEAVGSPPKTRFSKKLKPTGAAKKYLKEHFSEDELMTCDFNFCGNERQGLTLDDIRVERVIVSMERYARENPEHKLNSQQAIKSCLSRAKIDLRKSISKKLDQASSP